VFPEDSEYGINWQGRFPVKEVCEGTAMDSCAGQAGYADFPGYLDECASSPSPLLAVQPYPAHECAIDGHTPVLTDIEAPILNHYFEAE
jgi:hypothetical protein